VGDTNGYGTMALQGPSGGGVVLGTDGAGLRLYSGSAANTPALVSVSTTGSLSTSSSVTAGALTTPSLVVAGSSVQTVAFDAGGTGGANITNSKIGSTPYPLYDAVPKGGHRPCFVRLFNPTSSIQMNTNITLVSNASQYILATLATGLTGPASMCDTWRFYGTLGLYSSQTGAGLYLWIDNLSTGNGPGNFQNAWFGNASSSGNVYNFDCWWFNPSGEVPVTTINLRVAGSGGTSNNLINPTSTAGGFGTAGWNGWGANSPTSVSCLLVGFASSRI